MKTIRRLLASLFGAAACAAVLQAASAGGTGASAALLPAAYSADAYRALLPSSRSKIQHVVLIVQENHSFDNLFQGYPGASTQSYGYDSQGKKITLKQLPLGADLKLEHIYRDFAWNYDGGKMNGFDLNGFRGGAQHLAYTYVEAADIAPYLNLANRYVLADDYFPSQLDASFTAHQFLLAAQANNAVDLPTAGVWGCGGNRDDLIYTIHGAAKHRTFGPYEEPCFAGTGAYLDYETLGDLLDAKGLSWRWYSPSEHDSGYFWMGYQAVSHIYYGPDWKNVIHPETQVFGDIASGHLANMTWITPTMINSDHPGTHSKTGPSWVTSIVNAIGNSHYWNSTAIFVTWDEWGGEFDHVPPPQLFYGGLGIRVPLLCISPYAYSGVVNHTQLESSSIVRFVEDNFALGRLHDVAGQKVRDSYAVSAGQGCINPGQAARPFRTIAAPYSAQYFLHQPRQRAWPGEYIEEGD